MPVNVEVKAKAPLPFADLLDLAAKLTLDYSVLSQKDTFFGSKDGILLKLRSEEDCGKNQRKDVLIAYKRELQLEPKLSNYVITPVSDVDTMIDALTMSNGVVGVVEKKRHVFIVEKDGFTTRVHLDDVKGLGEYIEFEVIVNATEDIPRAEAFAEYLCNHFKILKDNHVAGAYFNILKDTGTAIPEQTIADSPS